MTKATGTIHRQVRPVVWQKKAQPRYNVVSMRVSDAELELIDQLRGNRRRSALIRTAFEELLKGQPDKKAGSHARP